MYRSVRESSDPRHEHRSFLFRIEGIAVGIVLFFVVAYLFGLLDGLY